MHISVGAVSHHILLLEAVQASCRWFRVSGHHIPI